MIKDPIVEEVRAAREKLFDACGGSLDTLLNHLKEREEQDRSRVVSPEIVKARRSTNEAVIGCPDTASAPASVPENEL